MKYAYLAFLLILPMLSVGQTLEYSVDFDGDDDYFQAPSIPRYDTLWEAITLSAWIKLDSSFSSLGTIVARRDSLPIDDGDRIHFELSVTPDKALLFTTKDNSVFLGQGTTSCTTSANVLTLDTWHYVSCSYNYGVMTFYVDGVQVLNCFDGPYPTEMTENSHWVNIGIVHRTIGDLFFNEFNGMITSVEIWSRDLNANEIANNMNCPPSGDEPDLLAYWNLQDSTGTTAIDLSTHANDGTLHNGAAWSMDGPGNSCTTIDSSNEVGLDLEKGNLFINSPALNGVILMDANGDCWKITVDTLGQLQTWEVVCPD